MATRLLDREAVLKYRSGTIELPTRHWTFLTVREREDAGTSSEQAQGRPRRTVEEISLVLGGTKTDGQPFMESRLRETHSWTCWSAHTGLETCRTRSTTGMVILRGSRFLMHSLSCSGLSSGETEYYARIRGACFGTCAHRVDFNSACRLERSSSFGKRRGLGQMRHVMTRFLLGSRPNQAVPLRIGMHLLETKPRRP